MYIKRYKNQPSFFLLTIFLLSLLTGCTDDVETNPSNELTTEEKFALLSEFQQETIDYFEDIALGFEFGNVSRITRKWTTPVIIKVEGVRPDYLIEELDAVIGELNALLTDGVSLRLSSENEASNFRVFFGSGQDYALLNPNAANQIAANRGLFYVNWNGSQNIIAGDMYVDTEQIEEVFQRHLLREELTQALGLAMDSPRYNLSIFQASWTDVTSYTELDEELIRLLYHPQMISGLNAQEVRRLLIDILYDEL